MKVAKFLRVRILPLIGALVLITGLMAATLPSKVAAGELDPRSLTLEAGTVPGAQPGDGNAAHTVKHLFTFTLNSTTPLGSIQFLYCTTPDPVKPCTTPSGLNTTAATLSSQTTNTGFTIVNTTNGAPYLTRTAANGVNSSASTYELSGIQNPDDTNCYAATPAEDNCTFYVRITTFSGTDGATGATDQGSVAASTATPIQLSGYMPESLVFCTGATISTTAGVPDCSTASSGAVNFNQDFSPTATATALSQMAASTNAGSGYAITVNGATLTSGLNTISGIGATAADSIQGTGQFGLNLVDNDGSPTPPYANAPTIGANPAPVTNGTNYRAQAVAPYDTDDSFAFNSTDEVADSGNGGLGGSDAQIYTVSYIVNVPGSQPAGTYTTTLTYICTPTF